MDVRVDHHRHHGLAGEIHVRGVRRHAHVGRLADLGDAYALHDQCRVLDHASVTDDQPRAFERGDGLPGRRYRESGKETQGHDYRHCDHIHSVHRSLHHALCARTPDITRPSERLRMRATLMLVGCMPLRRGRPHFTSPLRDKIRANSYMGYFTHTQKHPLNDGPSKPAGKALQPYAGSGVFA